MKKFRERAKPYLAVMLLQFGYAGMSIISKAALNKGMSPHVLVVYRHGVATFVIAPFAFFFERKVRPKMTIAIIIKILLLGLLEPTIDQNLFYTGMKFTTATFTAAMTNTLPAFAFLMAWILRLEKVNLRKAHSQAKLIGTIATVGGAFVMTLVKGAALNLPWTHVHSNNTQIHNVVVVTPQSPVKGSLMITAGCFCWAAFVTLQAITLKSYPATLSLALLICLSGTIEGSILAAVLERNNPSAWSIIHLDSKLLAVVYSGVVCSGIAYFIQGMVMKTRGPVFVTSFSPISMVLVAIMSSILLSETMYIGRITGAGMIVIGLYLVLWGKSKDQSDPETETSRVDNNQIAFTNSSKEFVAIDIARVKPTKEFP